MGLREEEEVVTWLLEGEESFIIVSSREDENYSVKIVRVKNNKLFFFIFSFYFSASLQRRIGPLSLIILVWF